MPEHMAGKPTNFVEQIWNCTDLYIPQDMAIDWHRPRGPFDDPEKYFYDYQYSLRKKKYHSIREDRSNRWKAGIKIHFVINNRTNKRFQFLPVSPCKSVQTIEITHSGEKWRTPWVKIDGRLLVQPEIDILAKNDGFDSTADFFAWFSEDFKGKIIHWTNLKY